MSEHAGLRGRVEAAGRNELLAGVNRMSGILASVVMLPLIAWLGLQVWGDIKDGISLNALNTNELGDKIDDLSAQMTGLKVSQAVTDTKLEGIDRRLQHIENLPPAPAADPKGRRK